MQTAHALVLIQKTNISLIGPRNGTISTQKPKTALICPGGSVFFSYLCPPL